jgi:hypothetical protein
MTKAATAPAHVTVDTLCLLLFELGRVQSGFHLMRSGVNICLYACRRPRTRTDQVIPRIRKQPINARGNQQEDKKDFDGKSKQDDGDKNAQDDNYDAGESHC